MIQIHQAGPINFIRTILIILLVYYGFKLLVKLIFPYIIKRFISKMQQQTKDQFNQQQQQKDIVVGETVIDKKPKSNSPTNNSVGEYIDFEEIE